MYKKFYEDEEDDDETIAILTEHQELKTRLKDIKTFHILYNSCLSLKTS